MSVTTNACVFECDNCHDKHIISHRFPGEYMPPPDGWWALNDSDASTAPLCFCSITCLYQWADGEVSS